MLKLLTLLGLLSIALAVEFLTWEGKLADPCNKFLSSTDPDCPPHSQLPDPTVTILVPSSTSAPKTTAGITTPVGGKVLGELDLNITGNQLPVLQWNYFALSTPEGSCRNIDTNFRPVKIAPQATTTRLNAQSLYFRLPTGPATALDTTVGWDSELLEIEDRPRLLCWSSTTTERTGAAIFTGPFRYTGFKIGVVWNCETSGAAGAACGTQVLTANQISRLTALQQQIRTTRTFCCKQASAIPGAMIGAGQCVNPRVQQCCGSAAVEATHERCCAAAKEIAAPLDGVCPCSKSVGDCPVGESCCLPSKYPELDATGTTAAAYVSQVRGSCYKPTKMRCCDTGSVFDPGSHQCCKINGVQSINVPCPCTLR